MALTKAMGVTERDAACPTGTGSVEGGLARMGVSMLRRGTICNLDDDCGATGSTMLVVLDNGA